MSTAAAAETFPRGALIGMGAMLAVSVAGTAAVRLSRLSNPPPAMVAPAAVDSADLRFADTPQGAIRVTDARSGAVVATLAPGTNGFVRGVMRGFARDRISRRLGEAKPFRLTRDRADHLWLQDTATGRLISLEAFGADNRAAFVAFLPAVART